MRHLRQRRFARSEGNLEGYDVDPRRRNGADAGQPHFARYRKLARSSTARVVLPLLAMLLAATPLSAQRAADLQVGAAHPVAPRALVAAAADSAGGNAVQPWVRNAIIGGAVGGLTGWLLSGLPCEGASGTCRSPTTSILVGVAIGAVIGALWSWRRP